MKIMKTDETSPTSTSSRGLSLWTALGLVLALAGASAVALGVLVYQWKADKARTQRQLEAYEARQMRAELEQKKTAQEAKLAQARNHQNALRWQAQHATNLLGQVAGGLQRLRAEAAALRTNAAGRQIAQYADLVGTARRLYETELRLLPSLAEIQGRQENARRVDQQMGDALGTIYEPDPGFAAALQNDVLTSGPELRRVEGCQSLLTGLIQEARAKTGAATMSPAPATLDAALAQSAQSESGFRQRIITEATEQAKPQAAQLIGEAERERIMEEARLQATKVANQMRDQMEKQKNESVVREAEFQKAVTVAQLQASNIAQAMEEMRAQHARELSVREAQRKVQDVKVQMVVVDQQVEARKIELRRKAQNPQLQGLLAPFTTPGYRQLQGLTSERQPISYTGLLNAGALTPGVRGLQRLVQIAMYNTERERPRWNLRGGPLHFAAFPESMDTVKAAQEALIELGPVMVELGMLAP